MQDKSCEISDVDGLPEVFMFSCRKPLQTMFHDVFDPGFDRLSRLSPEPSDQSSLLKLEHSLASGSTTDTILDANSDTSSDAKSPAHYPSFFGSSTQRHLSNPNSDSYLAWILTASELLGTFPDITEMCQRDATRGLIAQSLLRDIEICRTDVEGLYLRPLGAELTSRHLRRTDAELTVLTEFSFRKHYQMYQDAQQCRKFRAILISAFPGFASRLRILFELTVGALQLGIHLNRIWVNSARAFCAQLSMRRWRRVIYPLLAMKFLVWRIVYAKSDVDQSRKNAELPTQ